MWKEDRVAFKPPETNGLRDGHTPQILSFGFLLPVTIQHKEDQPVFGRLKPASFHTTKSMEQTGYPFTTHNQKHCHIIVWRRRNHVPRDSLPIEEGPCPGKNPPRAVNRSF
jgi:hypothetical protein